MSKPINTGFTILAPEPIDSRTVKQTYNDLTSIPVVFEGLKVYIIDTDKEYRYLSDAWVLIESEGAEVTAEWGNITGDIASQADLQNLLSLKFDKIGGTITGDVSVLADVTGNNFILTGSIPSNQSPVGGAGDMLAAFYDPNNNGNKVAAAELADNSALVNGLTVDTAVPSNALFTDTIYNNWNFRLNTDLTDYPIRSNEKFNVAEGTGIDLAWNANPDNKLTVSLADMVSITPGQYTNATVTVDSKGRITAASSGTGSTPIITTWEDIGSVPNKQAGLVLNITGSADSSKDFGIVVLSSSRGFWYDDLSNNDYYFVRITEPIIPTGINVTIA